MKRQLLILVMALLLPLLFSSGPAAGAEPPDYYQSSPPYGAGLLYPEELDDLLAPIALYPDPLIAQILPAATYPEQIRTAARFVRRYGNTSRIDYQPWDLSVRAVAHYPKLLYMMEREWAWTASLGQAFVEQPQDVMDAIQRLREDARDMGNLYTTPEQQVIYDGGIIRIVPARPQYVYVPVYDPDVVYVESYSYPVITFGVGLVIGAWLNRDCDWRRHRVYYHGWRGEGWVHRARPHIHDRRGVYIGQRASVVNINRRVVQQDTRVYRQRLRADTVRRREEGRMPPRTRVEQPRPGATGTRQPGRTEQRREPGTARQAPPAPGVQAPPATRQAPATTTPRGRQPGTQRQAPAGGTRREGVQQAPPSSVQPPAATGEQRRPAKESPGGEHRRRVPRPINRPTAPQATPQATPPATIKSAPPVAPAPGLSVPSTPRPGGVVVPTRPGSGISTPAPSVEPAPSPIAPPPVRIEPRVEPAPPQPGREIEHGGRGGRMEAPGGRMEAPGGRMEAPGGRMEVPGGRAAPRERR